MTNTRTTSIQPDTISRIVVTRLTFKLNFAIKMLMTEGNPNIAGNVPMPKSIMKENPSKGLLRVTQ